MILPLNIQLQLLNILNPCSTSFLSIIQSKLRLTTFNILKMWAPDIVAIAFQNKSLFKNKKQIHTSICKRLLVATLSFTELVTRPILNIKIVLRRTIY